MTKHEVAEGLRISIMIFIMMLPSTGRGQVLVNPTRPSVSDNAFGAGKGSLEAEFGFLNTPSLNAFPLLLKAGIDDEFEAGVAFSGLIQRDDSRRVEMGTPGVQGKLRLLSGSWGALSSVARVDFPAGPISFTVYPVLSLTGGVINVDITLAWTLLGVFSRSATSSFMAAASVSRSLFPSVSIFGEVYQVAPPEGARILGFDAGLGFVVSPTFVADAALGYETIGKTSSWLVQVGFTTQVAKFLGN